MAETEEVKQERNLRKVLTATVVSDKQDKTLVVKVDRRSPHPLYRKVVKVTSKCYVHDENNESGLGDTVEIRECPPKSKTKRWELVRVVEKSRLIDLVALRAAQKRRRHEESAAEEAGDESQQASEDLD